MRLLFIAILAIVVSACESTVTNVTPPDVDPELVVFSFISPESDSILVEVRMTTPVFKGGDLNEDRVSDATVTLATSGSSVVLPYTNNGRYVLAADQFSITPGTSYILTVTTPRGHRAQATTTVPVNLPVIDSVSEFSQPIGFGEFVELIRVYWQDASNEQNNYRLVSRSVSPSSQGGDTSYFIMANALLTDESKNGLQMSATVENYYTLVDSTENLKDVLLLNTDVNYHKYHVKRINYTGSNPFEEPLPMHDNIDGGVGCFSSYRMTKLNLF